MERFSTLPKTVVVWAAISPEIVMLTGLKVNVLPMTWLERSIEPEEEAEGIDVKVYAPLLPATAEIAIFSMLVYIVDAATLKVFSANLMLLLLNWLELSIEVETEAPTFIRALEPPCPLILRS